MKQCILKDKYSIFFLVLTLMLSCGLKSFAEIQPVKIKVAQYSKKIEFKCNGGASWKLGNDRGIIYSNDNCVVESKLTSEAVKKYHVIIKSVPISDKSTLTEELSKWKLQGWNVNIISSGKILKSSDGKVLNDPRLAMAEVEVFNNKKDAKLLIENLADKGQASRIFTEVIHLAKGTLTLKVNGQYRAKGEKLLIHPTETVLFKKVEYAAGYPWHGFEDRSYRGDLDLHFGAHNAVDVILNTNLEYVLAGVVPSEISASAGIGALQAQAVAARGDIIAKMGIKHAGEGFDVCSEQHCQVFKGETKYSIAVAKKIAPTLGYLLTEKSGKVLDAVYSASCGGHTEANNLVWDTKPNPILAGVWDIANPPALDLSEEEQVRKFILNPPKCYCDEGGKRFRWTKTISSTSLSNVENKLKIGHIKSIRNIARGYSGRIYQITFVGTSGSKTIFKELNVRRLLGSLRSSCFTFDLKKNSSGNVTSIILHGAGFGHGVGMCQTGAQSLAKRGWGFRKILSHYYPGSILKKWY